LEILADIGSTLCISPRLRILLDAMRTIPQWYQQGKIKPHICAVVQNDAKELQQAIDDIGSKKFDSGKVLVKVAA